MKHTDEFGDRMKMYEGAEAKRKLMPLLPIVARIDGRAFHKFTKGMDRPFDEALRSCMVGTTTALVKETGACIGYTQSDEISLVLYSDNIKSQTWFDGRIQKLVSQLAAQATIHFYRLVQEKMPKYADRVPTFDARVWNVPSLTEAANALVWRELDATKNSLSMAASALYKHSELHGKAGAQLHELLYAKGVNWNDYPAYFKRGTYVQRKTECWCFPFSGAEVDNLPPKHKARINPGQEFDRSVVTELKMPPITTVVNREDVFFRGASPLTSGELK